MNFPFRIGADENGLGARLGPLVVTAVLARVNERGQRTLSRRLPKHIRADLDDSKQLVKHGNVALGEAWARAVVDSNAGTPAELFAKISLEGAAELQKPCPTQVQPQCWNAKAEAFLSEREAVERTSSHLDALRKRGVDVVGVKSSVVCTHMLNRARAEGKNRFVSDLHAMERLVLSLRETAGQNVLAVCGKVGAMGNYSRFFGPLSGLLHTELEKQKRRSSYHFPQVGEVRFVQDADAHDPLVMLASLVGKWVRELLMERVARFYEAQKADSSPSGYNDPVTAAFVERTALARKRRSVPDTCFERARDLHGA